MQKTLCTMFLFLLGSLAFAQPDWDHEGRQRSKFTHKKQIRRFFAQMPKHKRQMLLRRWQTLPQWKKVRILRQLRKRFMARRFQSRKPRQFRQGRRFQARALKNRQNLRRMFRSMPRQKRQKLMKKLRRMPKHRRLQVLKRFKTRMNRRFRNQNRRFFRKPRWRQSKNQKPRWKRFQARMRRGFQKNYQRFGSKRHTPAFRPWKRNRRPMRFRRFEASSRKWAQKHFNQIFRNNPRRRLDEITPHAQTWTKRKKIPSQRKKIPTPRTKIPTSIPNEKKTRKKIPIENAQRKRIPNENA